MMGLFTLLSQMVDRLPGARDGEGGAPGLRVTSLQVELPVEARIVEGGELQATAPRGRLATGFMMPHGRLVARFGAEEAP